MKLFNQASRKKEGRERGRELERGRKKEREVSERERERGRE